LSYQILWWHAAAEDLLELTALNARQARRVMIAIRGLSTGQPGDFKKLSGSEVWRIRAGDWRVLVELSGSTAFITEIRNRRDAYE
jgi:mRNA-degrading endonuclease RelE of RelBE toxin-antitoxin system